MLSRALTTFAAILGLLLPATVLAQAPGAALPELDGHTFLVASSADQGATALDWYLSTSEAQPLPPLTWSTLQKKLATGFFSPIVSGLFQSSTLSGSAGYAFTGSGIANGTGMGYVGGTLTFRLNGTTWADLNGGTGNFETAGAVVATNGFTSRTASAALSLGSAGTQNIAWSVGNPLLVSFNTVEIGNTSTLQVDANATGLLVKSGGVARWEGIAAGTLPTCDAAHTNAVYFTNGTIVSDAVFCNGVNWQPFAAPTMSGYYDGNLTAANTVISGFSSFYGVDTGASFGKFDVAITRLGTDGTHNATWRIQNTSTATTVCTNTFLCNHAVGRIEVACTAGSTIQVANNLELQVDESACTGTIPLGNGIWEPR